MEAQSPQRRGFHVASARGTLLDAVAEIAHVVQEKVGVRVIRAVIERGDVARRGVQRRHVTLIASDLIERRFSLIRIGRDRSARRRGEQAHERRQLLHAVAEVVEIGTGIEGELAAVSVRTVLRRELGIRDAHLVEVRVAGELEERRILRFPSELADGVSA